MFDVLGRKAPHEQPNCDKKKLTVILVYFVLFVLVSRF